MLCCLSIFAKIFLCSLLLSITKLNMTDYFHLHGRNSVLVDVIHYIIQLLICFFIINMICFMVLKSLKLFAFPIVACLCFQTMLIWGQHVESIFACRALALLIQVHLKFLFSLYDFIIVVTDWFDLFYGLVFSTGDSDIIKSLPGDH